MTQGALTAIDPRPGWSWEPLGYLAPRVAEDGHGDLEPLSVYLGAGVVRRADREDNHNVLGADMDKYLRVLPGDLVFNKLRTWQGGLGASKYEGIVSPAYYILRPGPRLEPRFAHYLLVSTPYLAELTRLSKFMPPSQFDMPWEALKRLPIALPPVEEQQRIADFLDDQVARIDSLIGLRRQKVATLSELLQSTITAQVTIPVDGEQLVLVPLRHIATVRSSNVDKKSADGEQPVRLVNYTDVYYQDVITPELSLMEATATREQIDRFGLRIGDSVITKDSETPDDIAVPSYVQASNPEMVCGYHLSIIRPTAGIDSKFLYWALASDFMRGQFSSRANGMTRYGLSLDGIRGARVPLPSMKEQRSIADFLDGFNDSVRMQVNLEEHGTVLLEERKQSLITAAVTGELDVATAKPIGMGKWVPNVGASVEAPAVGQASGIGGSDDRRTNG